MSIGVAFLIASTLKQVYGWINGTRSQKVINEDTDEVSHVIKDSSENSVDDRVNTAADDHEENLKHVPYHQENQFPEEEMSFCAIYSRKASSIFEVNRNHNPHGWHGAFGGTHAALDVRCGFSCER